VAVCIFQEDLKAAPKRAPAWKPLLDDLVQLGDFHAKYKEFRILPTRGQLAAPRIMFLGLGKRGDFLLDTAREVGARVALTARDLKLRTAAVWVPPVKGVSPREAVGALAEGAALGLYEFREYKGEPKEGDDKRVAFEELRILDARAANEKGAKAVEEARIIAESTNLARTLIMRSSLDKPPEVLAKVAQAEAEKAGVKATVLAPAELKRLGLNALLGVGAGSVKPPRLVVLEYGAASKPAMLLCGKGITFDSGGISIKPADGMDRMKYDMAGSATVLGAILAAARLKLPVRIVAIMALAENMPSGSAIRPGDVLVAYNKKTIEVANTDAEGRLVLADALSYGVDKFKPAVAVDLATLTGAARVALGGIMTAVMGSDNRVIQSLIEAGRHTGDDLWQLPLNRSYEKQVQSDVAELRNQGIGGMAGAIVGGAFLKHFVDGTPWAHLDIAGTCWTEKGTAELQKEYLPKGATGIGVRLLVEWMRRYKA